ncbi:MAG: response regulator [Bacteroidota bacterium]
MDMIVEEKEASLQILFADTGQGIHPKDLPHVFDRYFQSKIPTKVSTGGTGVGLAICREYAKILNGDIQVQSEYGIGTTFTVTLPKTLSSVQISSNLLHPKPSVAKKSVIAFNSISEEFPTVLLVEDNAMMRSYIKYVLQKKYNVINANNGQEGLEMLAEHHKTIQLVLSDVLMPVMDGYEFLSALKANSTYAAIPTIMLTALSDTTHKLDGPRIGIDDYLTKPFVHEELLIRVEHLINNYQEKQNYILTILALDNITAEAASHVEGKEKEIYGEENNIETINIKSEDLKWLEEVEAYIKNHLQHTDFNIDTFVSNTAMSPSHFYRKIQGLTGLSPNDYINQIRFETARRMLENKKHVSVKSVAQAVEFRDIKYFSRKFKQLFGRNPEDYLE